MEHCLKNFHLILSILAISQILSPSFAITTIPINSLQTYNISSDTPLDLEILKNSSYSIIRSFNISIRCFEPRVCNSLFLQHKECENENKNHQLLPIDKAVSLDEILLNFSTVNTSSGYCFRVGFSSELQQYPLKLSILVNFTPKESLLQIGEPQGFEYDQGMEKEFTIDLKNKPSLETIVITINDKIAASQGDLKNITWELKQMSGTCFMSSTHVSWLCYLKEKNLETLKFTLFSSSSSGSHEIIISEVLPQKASAIIEASLTHFIPGHGSLFVVDVPLVGVLKLTATSKNGKPLKITTATSVLSLFSSLSQQEIKTNSSSIENREDKVIIQNKKTHNVWYYFVQEIDTDCFWLNSYLLKQETLEIDIQGMYYIDPAIYEYQHLRVNLGKRDLLEKYEITLHALQSGSHMNILYRENKNENSTLFPTQESFDQSAASGSTESEYLSFSFIAKPNNQFAYFTIHVLNKGFYTIEITKVESNILLQGVLVILVIWCIVILCFFAWSIFTKDQNDLKDINQFLSHVPNEGVTTLPETPTNNVELNSIDSSLQIVVHNQQQTNSNVKDIPKRFKNVIQKLRIQQELESVKSSINQDNKPKENEVVKDYRCDICYEAKRTVTFYPCNHDCACAFCALVILQTSAKCPLCRSYISTVD